jgi:DNA-binding transcriptional LysR family regulator
MVETFAGIDMLRFMPMRHELPEARRPLEIEQLRRLVAVARAGGFSAGARALRIAQPAVSRSIRALEDDLGVKLVERTTRRFVMTDIGERLVAECTALFDRLDALRSLAAPDDLDLRGALRIGATEPVAAAILPRAIAWLAARHPRLHPYVVVAPTRDLLGRLEASDLEVVLTFNPLRGGALVRRAIAHYRFHVVVAADRAGDPRTCESFFGSREVEDERERSFPALHAWRARWPRARIRASTNSIAAQVELVRSGAGVAVLPEFLVHRDLAEGRLLRGGDSDLVFPLVSVRRARAPSDAAAALDAALAAGALLVPGKQ